MRIASPCSERWADMRPRGEGRHCDRCDKTVVDLSRVTRPQAQAIVRAHGGQLCARLAEDERGELVFRAERRRLPLLAPVALAGLLAACVPEPSEEAVQHETDTAEVLDPGDAAHLDASPASFGGSLATGVMMPVAPVDAVVPPIATPNRAWPSISDGTPTEEQLALTRRKQQRRRQQQQQVGTGGGPILQHTMGVMACDLDP